MPPGAWHSVWALSLNASSLLIPLGKRSVLVQDPSPLPNLASVHEFKWVHSDCLLCQLESGLHCEAA